MNGRIGMDKGQGVFTCVTPRGSNVVDYLVASIDLFKCNLSLSDHRPLTTKITTEINTLTDTERRQEQPI